MPFLSRILLLLPLLSATAIAQDGTSIHNLRLKVNENRRFLVRDDGTPFFYLGDTAWELFHRLDRPEADRYLENRARKGFTVIQAVTLAELDGTTVPNAYGHLPLVDQDPARPAVKDGPGNGYWDHVDYVVDKANALGLVIGLLPTWGRYWHDTTDGRKPLFTAENARVYGRWLGDRYKDRAVIWILGGDRAVENDQQKAILRAMALGLRDGDGGKHLISFHPRGGGGSADNLHDEQWLDFNMRQNGHVPEFTKRYDATRQDYDRVPPKPVLDAEPIYEDHPVSFHANELGHSIAADVRRPLYWDLFGGACGHTYGHHSVWQMWQPGRAPINGPLMPWFEALDRPGAGQMQHGRRLMESRPMLARIPDDTLIVADRVPTAVPGAGRYRFVGTRDADGTYAMIYAPIGRAFTVRMAAIQGPIVKAWWFNPRNGQSTLIGEMSSQDNRRFTPPDPGEMLDWVLVLDDAAKGYPPPGQPRGEPDPKVAQPVKNSEGMLIHAVRSSLQGGATEVKVLLPDHVDQGRKYPAVYVLPVEKESENRFGDGLLEVKRRDLHNKFQAVFVAPTFSHSPWYADHPNDLGIRQESYLLKVVLPLVENRYPVRADAEGRLLLGFSKSGWGAMSLLLRHADVFGKAAAWDAPLMMEKPNNYGMGGIFGTQENFEKYQLSKLLTEHAKDLQGTRRLIVTGYGNFRQQHQECHELMSRLGIVHEYRDGPARSHDWHSGWVEEAVTLLCSQGKP